MNFQEPPQLADKNISLICSKLTSQDGPSREAGKVPLTSKHPDTHSPQGYHTYSCGVCHLIPVVTTHTSNNVARLSEHEYTKED